MQTLIILLSLCSGTLMLWAGGEFLIRGCASFALRVGLPILVIGLTVIGMGTSFPELVVTTQAALLGKGDIAVGNAIGSNIANTGLVLGVVAICGTVPIKHQIIRFDAPVMVLASLFFCLYLTFTNYIGRWTGFLLLVGLCFYLYRAISIGKENKELIEEEAEEIQHYKMKSVWGELTYIILGLCVIILGGRIFLSGAVSLARVFHISEAIIGVTVVALGTSIPELAVSAIAVIKRHSDFAIGNIIGSNIFNILAIIGITSTIQPITIHEIGLVDLYFMLAIVAFMAGIIIWTRKITRTEGVVLLTLYFSYIGYCTWTSIS